MKRKQIALVVLLLGLGLGDLLYLNLAVLPSLWAEPDAEVWQRPEPEPRHLQTEPAEEVATEPDPSGMPSPGPVAGQPAQGKEGDGQTTAPKAQEPSTTAALDGAGPSVDGSPPAQAVSAQTEDGEAQLVRETVLHFPPGSKNLTPEHRQQLKDLLAALGTLDSLRVEIHGHTDRTGAQSFDNQLLSRQRAESVASFLIQNGVEQHRVTIRGHGSSRPVDPGSNPAAWARNRRAEIQIFKGMP